MIITLLSMLLFIGAPESPKELVYPEYAFSVPLSDEYKEVLDNGVVVYIAENKELPLVHIVGTFIGGDYLDTVDGVGVTSVMASLVRSGGTETMTAEDVDERFAFLAADASVGGGPTTVTATLDCLSSNFKDSFDLFFEMIQRPGFQPNRIELAKTNIIEMLGQRNDQSSGILRREFSSKLFGDSYLGRKPVLSSIESIGVDDLRSRHKLVFSPSNLTLSVSGDFDTQQMLEFLNSSVGSWVGVGAAVTPEEVNSIFVPGIYYVDQDVPQGGVRVGIRSVQQGDQNVAAIEVMNYILGGGGFGSRITQSVRSKEGLAYSAGSVFSDNPWTDGVWAAGYESKSSTVALAAELIFDEINKIKTETVSEEELEQAKKSIIQQFPSLFQSKPATLEVFVDDTITNRSPEYWVNYRNNISAVTSEDVRRVANMLLDPKKMVMVVVGDWSEIEGGDAEGRSSMGKISDIIGGDISELPLRDPLTLEVLVTP